MKKYVLILLLLLPCISVVAEADISEFDGIFWQSWTKIEKTFFLTGFISASSFITDTAIVKPYHYSAVAQKEFNVEKSQRLWEVYLFSAAKGKKKPIFTVQDVALLLDLEGLERNENLSAFGIGGISVSQISDGLDLFYNDFKNRQIKLQVAIYLVKKQIRGSSAEEMEALVQFFRSGGKEKEKLFYYPDKSGYPKIYQFP